jgi:hypothetical protein
MDRFEIHTNFNNKPKVRYDIRPDNFCEPEQQRILKALFFEPKKLEPGETNEKITEEVAERFEKIADSLRKRKFAAEEVSHFLMKLMSIMRTRSWMKPSSRPTAGVPP